MKSIVQTGALKTYSALTRVLAPAAAFRLSRSLPPDSPLRRRQAERFGDVPTGANELWIHAASVGEVHAIVPLVHRLLSLQRSLKIVLSTLTVTGAERVAAILGDQTRVRHAFAPLDTVLAVRRWLERMQPRALLLVETELWPVMLNECARQALPVALVNARLSTQAMQRYRRFRVLFGPAVQTIDPILCQSDRDRVRFETIGAAPAQLQVTGNIKLDTAATVSASEHTLASLDGLIDGLNARPCWVAGSTHPGEESIVLAAHHELLKQVPEALLVLVPRHPERAPAVLKQVRGASLEAGYSTASTVSFQVAVEVRMGVLAELYRHVGACFVGGSLVSGIGGHNLFEPAAAGRAVITGPFTEDQRDAAALLEPIGGLVRVHDAADLAAAVLVQLKQGEDAKRRDQRASTAVQQASGSLARSVAVLNTWIANRD
ncbi:MAG: 3-deoxy-D-manno-octulosonic acid transferase [Pseudomonadota bacterium]